MLNIYLSGQNDLSIRLDDMVTYTQIDEAVLAIVEPSWRKVAMIVSKAAQRLGSDLPDGDAGYQMVATRIQTLVHDGRLIAQGDVSRWRHSEVRRA